MSLLAEALVFLAAAALSVPISKRLGLGSVLGYLAAGAVIGPFGFRFVSDVHAVLHLAELGVVLLLFLIGLELQPSRLWALRRSVFGYGSAQVVLTSLLLFGVGLLFGLSAAAAGVVAVGLSLSSTAFALQLLGEKNQLTRDFGQASFGILLFQDLAVLPVLALLPLLGTAEPTANPTPAWLAGLKVVGVLAAVIVGGRYVLRPAFRVIADTRSQEVFTAAALLVVGGTALLVNQVGLSMALGAFLAGVLLADSEYRHELEADLEPFKGLLLGLFFIAVGMSVQLGLIREQPLRILLLVLGLTALKGAVLFGIGKRVLRSTHSAVSLAAIISQGGEFAFVLFRLAVDQRILSGGTSDLLVVVVSLSMALTPLLVIVTERWVLPRLKRAAPREFDVAPEEAAPVIVAGFGRVGQVVGRVLRAKHIPFTAMDISAEHIDFIRKFGGRVFYGDASRLDLLRAAHADKARVFVLAIDDVEASLRTAEIVKEHFPNLTIVARARNRAHAYRLMAMGIQQIIRETFAGSLEMTQDVLQTLGLSYSDARVAVDRFRDHDEQLLKDSFEFRQDEAKLMELAARGRSELESLFEADNANERKSA